MDTLLLETMADQPQVAPVAQGDEAEAPPRRGLFQRRGLFSVRQRRALLLAVGVTLLFGTVLSVVAYREIRRSDIQSWYLSRYVEKVTYAMAPGASDAVVFPEYGPFDVRLGYALMPKLLERVLPKGFEIESQVRLSPEHHRLVKKGIYALYHEKAQAGLTVLDRRGQPLFTSKYPQLIYQSFADIPKVIVDTLLFIENRELLDERYPKKNPVIEWDRLGLAVFDLFLSKVIPGHDVPGGSTLATQIEKYRHSPEGRTSGLGAKATQMASATLRAYLDGPNTRGARERIVTDYINTVPLGAIPGGGEVKGLGHGMMAWHGADFARYNDVLKNAHEPAKDAEELRARGQAYKEILSLFLAQRRPAYYLQTNRDALKDLTKKHLGPLERAGVISPELRAAINEHQLTFRNNMLMFQPERLSFLERKAANAVRVYLLGLFGFDRLYTLDRLDLTAHSTIDYDVQKAVTGVLAKLKDPAFAAEQELKADRLLLRGDPKEVVYSFTLRERVGDSSVLRVQADNVDGPFNVNEGGKLELGSTAKLRTLATYLETIEALWTEYSQMTPEQLAKVKVRDRLSVWALSHMRTARDKSLLSTLQAAMSRPYDASPKEGFFTGSGLHHFSNFKKEDDARVVTVTEALQKSINLPFVRMMRDIVHYHTARIEGADTMLVDPSDPQRKQYLTRFAAKEGKDFLGRFFLRYRGKSEADVLATLMKRIRPTVRRLAAVYVTLRPDGDLAGFKEFIKERGLTGSSDKLLEGAYHDLAKGDYGLQERGYIAGVHPLELWLAGHLIRSPGAGFSQVMEASQTARQDAYKWLFDSKDAGKQNKRIRIMLEEEAFQKIHASWQKVGFPFVSLVPTLATALGSSGDKPAALAELIGIIQAGGVRYPATRVTALHFGEGTPFETKLRAAPTDGTRVMAEEVAIVLREALQTVVDDGTAVRVRGAFTGPDGTPLAVGGKTGTGDNRYSIFAPGGRVIESKAMSRTATFVFYIGDRFFGTLTAYVPSVQAGEFNFTSALPVQILKILSPHLQPLVSTAH